MPSRDVIKPQVIQKIATVAEKPSEEIHEKDRLWEDLHMAPLLRKAMSKSYTRLAKKYEGGLPISMDEAEGLETVKASIDLVTKRANGDPE